MGIFNIFKRKEANRRFAIFDVTDRNFETQVIRRSFKTPVLVDFWAAWCGPCRQLGPVLERLAEAPESEFLLAKLNTEHNKRTAAAFNIRSIPAVKMFRNGVVVDEFTGALPMGLVRRFVEKTTAAPPPPPRLKGSGSPAKRLQQAEQHLKKGRGFEAFVLLQQYPAGPQSERAGELLPLARFLFDMADGDGLTGVAALDDAYQAAAQALGRRKPDLALARLSEALDLGEKIDQPHTTKVIESLLALLGQDHPLTRQYREREAVA